MQIAPTAIPMRIPNIAELKFHRRNEQLFCLFAKETLWGSFVPQTLSKGFFFRTAGEANTYRTDPGSVRCTQAGEQHYVQGPSRSMLPPLLGTQAMPKATASSTCEHRAPAHERLGLYAATCCAMELAVAPISHGRLHSTPRSSNQPVGIYSYCRCTWDDDHNQRYCCGPDW